MCLIHQKFGTSAIHNGHAVKIQTRPKKINILVGETCFATPGLVGWHFFIILPHEILPLN